MEPRRPRFVGREKIARPHGPRVHRDIILDVSRLLSRAASPSPTGIDRVEMIYAERLIARVPTRLHFLAVVPSGRAAILNPALVRKFLTALAERWHSGGSPDVVRGLAWRLRIAALRGGGRKAGPGAAYLLLSHHHLDKPDVIVSILRRTRSRLVCLMHDLIPLDFPEYGRPGEDAKHRLRLETVGKFSEATVAVSHTVKAGLEALFARMNPSAVARVHAVPHGASRHVSGFPTQAFGDELRVRPYFVCLGTIEPRKNHLMLLALWRRLANDMGEAAPLLVLVGRRGWENENILDLLQRCPALQDVIVEREGLPDRDLHPLLAGARALLFPSFAEGYGLPLAESLAQGVPAVCSDIAALREVGGDVPDYLDPLDGLGWRRAVLDYLPADSPRRAAQLLRLAAWNPPDWDDSVSGMLAIIDGLPAAAAGGRAEQRSAEHPVP